MISIRIERIRAGQPRKYADSVYESVITTISASPGHNVGADFNVKKLAQIFVCGFVEPDEDGNTPFMQPYLKSFAKEYEKTFENGEIARRYRIIVIEPYAD